MKLNDPFPYRCGMFILLASIVLLQSSCRQRASLAKAVSIADTLRQTYAPDSRTTDFHVHFELGPREALIVIGETSSEELGKKLMDRLHSHYEQIIDSFSILPKEELARTPMALVRIGVAPVRGKPAFSSQQVTQALMGMPVRLLKKEESWIRVQLPDEYLGWIESNSLVPLKEEEFQAWRESRRVLSTALHGRLYHSPSVDSPVIAHVTAGALLAADKSTDEWIGVRLPDHRTAWIQKSRVIDMHRWRQRASGSNASDWVYTADTFSGLPYLWGGTSAYGLDCSGFIKMALYLNGLIIPRDASQQVEAGIPLELHPEEEIDWGKYQIGDLFFFGTKRKDRSNRITHVAFHTGGGDVLHSTTWVRRESLDEKDSLFNAYRRSTLLEARRFDTADKGSNKITPVDEHSWYFPKE